MAKFAVILPAAGSSSRFKDKEKKPFATLDGRAVWLRSAELFVSRSDVCQCLVVIAAADEELFRRRYLQHLAFMNVQLVLGGAERFESVASALGQVKPEAEFVAVHDAVRPCLTGTLIDAVFARAAQAGAALLAVPITDTVKKVAQQQVEATLPRQGLWLAQTPQVFRRDWLSEAYANRGKLGKDITDDAQLVEAAGHKVAVVEGAPTNVKITTRADLVLAEAVLKALPKPKPARAGAPVRGRRDVGRPWPEIKRSPTTRRPWGEWPVDCLGSGVGRIKEPPGNWQRSLAVPPFSLRSPRRDGLPGRRWRLGSLHNSERPGKGARRRTWLQRSGLEQSLHPIPLRFFLSLSL
jgi:2-C-methyl-D-erythritol 4-phosphate cytidylyltransferase